MAEVGPPKQEIGASVPEFGLPLLGNGHRTLQSFLEGKRGAVVLFWSGVCSHCVRYDGYLNEFQVTHPELHLVAVASRQGETTEQLQATIAERRLQFPILHDSEGLVARQYVAQQTPLVYLIDPERILLYRGAIVNFKYPADSDYLPYLEPAIQAFLSGQPIARPETASFGCAIQS